MVARLSKAGRRLSFRYEAGPCDYGLHRLLTSLGHDYIVVAPSLIPIKAGDRVKTDRRDALMLAKLHRAGELTAIWIPDTAHEAMRDLVGRERSRGGYCRRRAASTKLFAVSRTDLSRRPCVERIYRGGRAWTLANGAG